MTQQKSSSSLVQRAHETVSEEVSGALPSLISLTVSVDVKPYVLLLLPVFSAGVPCEQLVLAWAGIWTH